MGSLGVFQLKRLWSAAIGERQGSQYDRTEDWEKDRILLDALGLGLQQVMQYLYQEYPSFEQFENWIIAVSGAPDRLLIERINAEMLNAPVPGYVQKWIDSIETAEPVFSRKDLEFWDQFGYVVLTEAVTENQRDAAERAIWNYMNATLEDPDSWYQGTDHGMMLEFIQGPALQSNRLSARIHKAFAQLWGTANLWSSADRCSFHAPQRENHPFPGPDLHWDIDWDPPLNFGTQGILYLTDTPAEQGAFTLVPGFHNRLEDWLNSLPADADPQQQDLHALGSIPVPALGGDMVIWNQLLPHGSRPNLGPRPRIVQYINMRPLSAAE